MKVRTILTALLVLAVAAPVVASISFPDVPASHPRAGDIHFVAEKGWFQGYRDKHFRPDQRITSEEIAIVSQRAFPDGLTRSEMASFLRGGFEAVGETTTTSTTTTVPAVVTTRDERNTQPPVTAPVATTLPVRSTTTTQQVTTTTSAIAATTSTTTATTTTTEPGVYLPLNGPFPGKTCEWLLDKVNDYHSWGGGIYYHSNRDTKNNRFQQAEGTLTEYKRNAETTATIQDISQFAANHRILGKAECKAVAVLNEVRIDLRELNDRDRPIGNAPQWAPFLPAGQRIYIVISGTDSGNRYFNPQPTQSFGWRFEGNTLPPVSTEEDNR